MRLLVLDNYDSFTYNLVHMLEHILDEKVAVHRNDQMDLAAVASFDKILLSPGPGLPKEAGILLPLIETYAPSKPILGVCLGHQALAEAFGANLFNLKEVQHGVSTPITIVCPEAPLFAGLPSQLQVGRYHSWMVSDEQLPTALEVTARDEQGYIMALQHREYAVQGVQFHPESVLTPEGERMLRNWLFC